MVDLVRSDVPPAGGDGYGGMAANLKHARSAVGMDSLPFGIPVEIDMIVELKDEDDC